MGLEYLYPNGGVKACAKEPLKVKLDGKHVGEIRKVKDGYQYYPKGEKKGGMVFEKVSFVQNSLLCTQPTRENKKQNVHVVDGDSADEIIKQAKAGLKKQEKELKEISCKFEIAKIFLAATVDLLHGQVNSNDPINLLENVITYHGTECDGHTLLGDITEYLQ